MSELETLLRERLRAADSVRVPVDVEAIVRAGRRTRRARLVRWVLAAVAAVAGLALLVAVVWQRVPGRDADAVPDPLQSPTATPTTSTTASPTPSTTPRPTPSGTSAARPGAATVTLEVDFRGGKRQVGANLHPLGVQFTGEAQPARLVEMPSSPGRGSVLTGYPSEGWTVVAVNGQATWLAPLVRGAEFERSSWSADVEVFPGAGITAGAVRFDAGPVAAGVHEFLWGDAAGEVYLLSDKGASRRVDSATFDSVQGGRATFVYDQQLDVWLTQYRTWGTRVAMPSLHPHTLPAARAASDDLTRLEAVVVLPAGVDPATVTWGVPYQPAGALQVQTLPGGRSVVRQEWVKTDTNLEGTIEISYTDGGRRVTRDVTNT